SPTMSIALLFLLCDGPQRVDLSVSVERVVVQGALAYLRRAIVHRREGRIDRKVGWTVDRISRVLQLGCNRAGTRDTLTRDERSDAGGMRRCHRSALQIK